MNHRVSIDRAVRIMITVLCTAGAATLGAQQVGSVTQPQPAARAVAQAISQDVSGLGPRLPLEVAPFEPSVADRAASPSPLFDGGDNHTFVFSTLALVLIGGLVFLLLVR
jgi:hypothetical protein